MTDLRLEGKNVTFLSPFGQSNLVVKKFQRLSDLIEAEGDLRVADRLVRVQFVRQRVNAFADETVLIDERFARGEELDDVRMSDRFQKLKNEFESRSSFLFVPT